MRTRGSSEERGTARFETFPSTCWTRLRSREDGGAQALRTLAEPYWPAVVVWLRRSSPRAEEEAWDLAQGFFLWVLETDFLAKADPERGRFRAFLKTALRHWSLTREREQATARRGGGVRFVPLVSQEGEALDLADPGADPDAALDATWRATMVEAALERMRKRLEEGGHGLRYAIFHAYHVEGLGVRSGGIDYEALAARHGISRVDVSNHLARAKETFRDELRALVHETVGSDEELRAELDWLLGDRS
jgi:RNA polymerase sigma-70 factor (ECF subfamily)